jgi:hypothetical protein
MERSGKSLEAVTDRWRKRAAEIREDLQLNCKERQKILVALFSDEARHVRP